MLAARTPVPYLLLVLCTFLCNTVNSAGFGGNVRGVKIGGGGLSGILEGISIFPTTTLPPPEDILPPTLFDNFGDPGDPACMDLMIVVDVTCSADESDLQNVRMFTAELVDRLMSIPGSDIQVGVALHGTESELLFNLGTFTTRSSIVDAILNMELDIGCNDENTEKAFRNLATSYFTVDNGDREDKRNVAILFTGKTVTTAASNAIRTEALSAKANGVEINIVTITEETEDDTRISLLDDLPSSPEMVYEVDNIEHIGDLTDDLSSRYFCGESVEKDCAEIVFAFDVSCSIDDGNISSAMNIAKEITLSLGNSSKYWGFTYDNNTVDSFPPTDAYEAANKISELKRPEICTQKTRTNRAISFANKKNTENEVNHRGTILIIFGDGLESPWRENELAIAAADRLKQNGGAIIWIILTSKRKEQIAKRGIDEQIYVTASENIYTNQRLAFDHNEANVVEYVTEYIELYFKQCPITSPPEDVVPPTLFDNFGNPGDPACMDLMIVVDVTCSADEDDLQKVRLFAAELVERLMSIPGSDIQVGVALYGIQNELLFNLGSITTRSAIVDAIVNMDLDIGCNDANTEKALYDLTTSYFTSDNGARKDKRNVAVLFTGNTVKTDAANTIKTAASRAKATGVEINIVTITEEKEDNTHISLLDDLPSSPELVYEVDNIDHIGDLTDDLSSRYFCGGSIKKACAEVVYAFDVSCSIDYGNATSAMNIANEITRALGNSSKYCGFSYDNNTVDSFPPTDAYEAGNKISELKRPDICTRKTRTNRAINFANKNYFENAPNQRVYSQATASRCYVKRNKELMQYLNYNYIVCVFSNFYIDPMKTLASEKDQWHTYCKHALSDDITIYYYSTTYDMEFSLCLIHLTTVYGCIQLWLVSCARSHDVSTIGGYRILGAIKGGAVAVDGDHMHDLPPKIPPSPTLLYDNGGAYGDPACLNMQIILDISCFLSLEDFERAKNVTKYIIKEIESVNNSSANIGLILHKLKSSAVVSTASSKRLENAIDAYTGTKCTIKPEGSQVKDRYLEETLGDIQKTILRNDTNDNPDVLLIFTDGHKSGYLRQLDEASRIAGELRQIGVEINVISVPSRTTEELDSIASSYRLYDSNNAETERNIVNDLTSRYSCLSTTNGDEHNPYLHKPGDCVVRKLGDVMLRCLQITTVTGEASNIAITTGSCPKR
ncbi:unnamed protein product [Owenia fusiformis]|uniref:VWFA domain-containing protein n=1 Tax=Owenia fusiformis TaxID=6347 RepID=A0A8S4Q5L4_OWEFU|nr:unnamed protein product [Owenia fusiformis]